MASAENCKIIVMSLRHHFFHVKCRRRRPCLNCPKRKQGSGPWESVGSSASSLSRNSSSSSAHTSKIYAISKRRRASTSTTSSSATNSSFPQPDTLFQASAPRWCAAFVRPARRHKGSSGLLGSASQLPALSASSCETRSVPCKIIMNLRVRKAMRFGLLPRAPPSN